MAGNSVGDNKSKFLHDGLRIHSAHYDLINHPSGDDIAGEESAEQSPASRIRTRYLLRYGRLIALQLADKDTSYGLDFSRPMLDIAIKRRKSGCDIAFVTGDS